jgi:hypothetical protein
MCAKLSVGFDIELKWRFGVQLKGSLVAMVGSLGRCERLGRNSVLRGR